MDIQIIRATFAVLLIAVVSIFLPDTSLAQIFSESGKSAYIEQCAESISSFGSSPEAARHDCACVADELDHQLTRTDLPKISEATPNPQGDFYDRKLYEILSECGLTQRTNSPENAELEKEQEGTFWVAVVEGWSILGHWRVWAIVLIYGVMSVVMLVLIAYTASINMGVGCFSYFLIGPLWNGVVLTCALLVLTPLLLFGENQIVWEVLRIVTLTQIFLIAAIGIGTGLLTAFIPFLGQLPSISAFAQGAAILAAIAHMASGGTVELWPGLWNAIGFAVAGAIISYLCTILFLPFVALADLARTGLAREDLATAIGAFASGVPAMLPVFFYAGWLRVANGL